MQDPPDRNDLVFALTLLQRTRPYPLEPDFSELSDQQLLLRLRFLLTSHGWLLPEQPSNRVAAIIAAWRGLQTPSPTLAQLAERIPREPRGAVQAGQDGRRAELRQRLGLAPAPTQPTAATSAPPPPWSESQEAAFLDAVLAWLQELASNPRWTSLPSVTHGEAPAPIDQVYVELHVVPPTESDAIIAGSRGTTAQRALLRRRSRQTAFPIDAILTRVRRRLVIVGDPGAGKSTLVQWLAHAIASGVIADFGVPLVVGLAAYAATATAAGPPPLTPLGYFFSRYLPHSSDAEQAAAWLRQQARASGKLLLLLDGWDEVPPERRETLRQAIVAESESLVTVITSRPVGAPGELCEAGTSIHELAGLGRRTRDELIRRQLQRRHGPAASTRLSQVINADPDLCEMAANPFLLTLMTRVAAGSPADLAPLFRSRRQLFRSFADWMRDQHNQRETASLTGRLSAEHEVFLERLAYELLVERDAPEYIFHKGDIEAGAHTSGVDAQPILASRLLRTVEPATGLLGFVHASFQEFFAAENVLRTFTAGDARRGFHLGTWLARTDRQVLLEFLASSPEGRAILLPGLAGAVARPDRFGVVTRRAARLAAIARSDDGGLALLGTDLRPALWRHICGIVPHNVVDAFVTEHIALDARDFIERLLTAPPLEQDFALQLFIERAPRALLQEARVQKLLDERWPDHAGLEGTHEISERELVELRRVAEDDAADLGERANALRRIGQARDQGSLPLLLRLLDAGLEDALAAEVVYALGPLGGRAVAERLTARLLDPGLDLEESMAVDNVLQANAFGPRGALDPTARDQLLQFLALSPRMDARREHALSVLRGMSIREGGELLLDEAVSGPSTQSCEYAAEALATWRNPNAAALLLNAARTAPFLEARRRLMEAVAAAEGGAEAAWLVEWAGDDDRPIADRAQAFETWATLEKRTGQASARLRQFVAEILGKEPFGPADLDPLHVAMFDVASLMPDQILPAARRVMEAYLADQAWARPVLLLSAASALESVGAEAEVDLLERCLDHSLAKRGAEAEPFATVDSRWFEPQLAIMVLKRRPEAVLRWPQDPIRHHACQEWVHQQGLLVHDDEVRDGFARVVVGNKHSAPAFTGHDGQPRPDVFVAYNSADHRFAEALARALRGRGLVVWRDRERLLPGDRFQGEIQQALQEVGAVAILVGPTGLGKFQSLEVDMAVDAHAQRGIRVVPVLLPGVAAVPATLRLLAQFHAVRFCATAEDPQAVDTLFRGIKGG